MSTLRCNAIQDTAGVERYLARAWVNFNGTGTVAIRAAGNVSSITDNGVGDYTVNFTTAMPDANYTTVGMANVNVTGLNPRVIYGGAVPTTSSIRVICSGTAQLFDQDIYVAIFR